ncbi:hypothetical protein B7W85_07255 [Allorhizobium ampelinum]|nr:hypothetical protein B7W85_07255 [Allorhizobium ampelinum]
MKTIVHIEALDGNNIKTIEQKAQTFLSTTRDRYGSIGLMEWDGVFLKIYIDLPFPVSEPSVTTNFVEDATDVIASLKKAKTIATGEVETEYVAYDATAFQA